MYSKTYTYKEFTIQQLAPHNGTIIKIHNQYYLIKQYLKPFEIDSLSLIFKILEC